VNGEVGYWIGREYWGKGVATEALSQFLAHAEVRRPLHAAVAKHNVGSIRVLEKAASLSSARRRASMSFG
jgi:RimJ/RimL family protein N-acetyltransferase